MRLVASEQRLPRPRPPTPASRRQRGTWITFLDDDDRFEPDHLAGLLAAAREVPQARVITSYAKAVFRDGHVEWVGQPFSLAQLYERNFIHLSSAIFARELVDDGCRFDESLEILEDWDFMLQLAQRAAFHFVPLRSFRWNADSGDSGAGGGREPRRGEVRGESRSRLRAMGTCARRAGVKNATVARAGGRSSPRPADSPMPTRCAGRCSRSA